MKILLCDDHRLFREGLRLVLAPLDSELTFIEAGTAEEACALAVQHEDLDLVLMDLTLPGVDGIGAIERLRAARSDLPVVVVSQREDVQALRSALQNGALGFIPKSASGPVLRAALQLVLAGGVYVPPFAVGLELTPAHDRHVDGAELRRRYEKFSERQGEVARLMGRGLTNAEIASVLKIREPTVKTHVAAVFAILDVKNRSEVGMVLRELGVD